MPEVKTKMTTYEVNYLCDECRKENLKWTGVCLTSYPAQYPHQCPGCGAQETFTGICYPRIEYKEDR